jgi:D-hexose-6-phosphate mutarotase
MVSSAFPTVVLVEDGSEAVLAPARGGLLAALRLRGRDLLFLDEKTYADPSANVRGGSPVLSPSPGKLAGDTWAHGTLRQHGFARNLPWGAWVIQGRILPLCPGA